MLILGPLQTTKEVYNPKAFFPHAASLDQAFAHCPKFPIAATRRCMFRISVTLWGAVLSHPLAVIALVGHYPTNKLIRRGPLHRRAVKPYTGYRMSEFGYQTIENSFHFRHPTSEIRHPDYGELAHLSAGYSPPMGTFPRVTHPSATARRSDIRNQRSDFFIEEKSLFSCFDIDL